MKNTTEYYYNLARKTALAKVEVMARRILKENTRLDEYIMAMGTAFFTTKDGENLGLHDRVLFSRLNSFIQEWDNMLYLTGEPMRFTAEGEKVIDW